jgi:transcription-repair coupling factor (superfamily II helicase)
MPVNVDLPLAIGIPIEYVPDQNMRLKLYRRVADLQNDDEIQTISEEFTDRFGPLPEPVNNLIYQFRIKVRAEAAGLASVTVEGEQIVLRYPPLPDGVTSRNLPYIGSLVRSGKNAFWLPLGTDEQEWKTRLLETLSVVIKECPLS